MSKTNIGSRKRARYFALQALYQCQFNPKPIAEVIADFISQPEMVSVDTDFFQKMVREIIMQSHDLNQLMQPLLIKSESKPQPVEQAILWIGTYELKYELATPYRVVINEAIELAKLFGATGSYRYINGVLHGIATVLRPLEVDQ
jgi:transcription antitermination protein NusB